MRGPPEVFLMLKLSVRSHTSLPVPNVLAWNSYSSNPVGAEYLVLEKVTGKQLNEVWDEMTGRQRFRLVTRLAQFDAELSKIRFPAYGSLYHRATSKDKSICISLLISIPSINTVSVRWCGQVRGSIPLDTTVLLTICLALVCL